MRLCNIYILPFIILGFLCSCIQEEAYNTTREDAFNEVTTFSATPKGYIHTNVGTKAVGSFNPETFENTIYNAFFMLFDNGGTLRILEPATVSNDNSTVSYTAGGYIPKLFPNARICFLANVLSSAINFTVGTTKWSDIENFYLGITYAPNSSTGCIGIPESADLNNDGNTEHGLPMFGSKVMTSANITEPIQLERLLARVEIYFSLGIEDNESITTLLSEPQFGLESCQIHNIPRFIPLTSKTTTAYSTIEDDNTAKEQLISESYSTYNLDLGSNKILYYSSADTPEYKSIYFYTPEHTLGGNLSDNTVSANKSEIVKESKKRPIYTTISGFLVDGDGTSYEAIYQIYLGGNSTNNFDIFRNKVYKNYIRINGVENGPGVDHRVVKLDELKDIINDVSKTGQCANCYIISSTGTYMLPAYRGAYASLADAQMCDVGENIVLACDNPNISISIDQERSKQSTIVFEVGLNNTSLLSGNAVIGRINSQGQVDWSWHLWFIPGVSFGNNNSDLSNTLRIGGLVDENMYDNTTMANRNIGVTGSVTDLDSWLQGTQSGYHYKYGYRQPYFEDRVYNNGTKYHGMNENEQGIPWSSSSAKSKTDPCPPGYRIPSADIWRGGNDSNATKTRYSAHIDRLNINVDAFRYWDRGDNDWALDNLLWDEFGINDIYYPYSGYIDSNDTFDNGEDTDLTPSKFKANDYSTFRIDEGYETTPVADGSPIPSTGDIGIYKWEYETQNYKYTRYRFVEFEYTVILKTSRNGYLWATGNEYLHYPDKEVSDWNTLEITGCKYETATVTKQMSRSRSKAIWDRNWSAWSEWDDVILSEKVGSYGNATPVADPNNAPIVGAINNSSWKSSLRSNQSNRYFGLCKIFSFETAPDHGYQIRCVKEPTTTN